MGDRQYQAEETLSTSGIPILNELKYKISSINTDRYQQIVTAIDKQDADTLAKLLVGTDPHTLFFGEELTAMSHYVTNISKETAKSRKLLFSILSTEDLDSSHPLVGTFYDTSTRAFDTKWLSRCYYKEIWFDRDYKDIAKKRGRWFEIKRIEFISQKPQEPGPPQNRFETEVRVSDNTIYEVVCFYDRTPQKTLTGRIEYPGGSLLSGRAETVDYHPNRRLFTIQYKSNGTFAIDRSESGP